MAKILVTWVARTNDPYAWDAKSASVARDDMGQQVYGPTLTLLLDLQSPYQDIRKAYFFYRTESDTEALEGIHNILKRSRTSFQVEACPWNGSDPSDHKALFKYLQPELKKIREQHPNDELVINVSPGTPAMHTVWVLLAEVGYISHPLTLVQCRRWRDRKGQPPVERISIGIENYFKQYQDTMSGLSTRSDEDILWNPTDFRSKKLIKLDRDARRYAKIKTPILILGERGTGKSTWATWIRANSPYKKLKQSWMSVACGQFNSELMRSELFGHVKGAFTGATADKPGLLKRMDKDTLFLDEIGDIDTDTQRLLIKALEEKEFQPLGSEHAEKSDFRLITATNRSLEFLRTKIHEDFFDRISPLILVIPPLREIPEDISWIWQDVYRSALSRAAVDSNKPEFSAVNHAAIVNFLQCHTLPGNYRDLYRVAYRLIAFLNDLDVEDSLSDAITYALSHLQPTPIEQAVLPDSTLPNLADGFSIEAYLSEVRRNLILHALKQSSGNQRKAASLLGISPQAINKFKKNEITLP